MSEKLTLIVTGGRNYSDRHRVFGVLDNIDRTRGIAFIVQGGAPGADAIARDWANMGRKGLISYMAEWDKHGPAAGPLRNQRMIDEAGADGVIAFPGGRGTDDCVRRAEAAGLPVFDLRER